MIIKHIALLVVGTGFALISCKNTETSAVVQRDPLATNRDTTLSPGDDFFHYANGSWFKKNPIPETESSNGIFRTIGDTINAQIKAICIKSAEDKEASKGSNKQKIGDFYASGMDTIAIEKAGITPLKTELSRIESIKDLPSLMETIGYLHTLGTSPAFNFY
jgi:putative endopeptidase